MWFYFRKVKIKNRNRINCLCNIISQPIRQFPLPETKLLPSLAEIWLSQLIIYAFSSRMRVGKASGSFRDSTFLEEFVCNCSWDSKHSKYCKTFHLLMLMLWSMAWLRDDAYSAHNEYDMCHLFIYIHISCRYINLSRYTVATQFKLHYLSLYHSHSKLSTQNLTIGK